MNKKSPLLSICIPTFNRSLQVESLVRSLQKCINTLGGDIEILVSDNCSTDNTEEVVRNLSQDLNFLYFRHEYNMGATKNYLFLMRHAKGVYLWLLGDDDIIDSDEIIRFVHLIKLHQLYSVIIVDTINIYNLKKLINMPNIGPLRARELLLLVFRKSLSCFGHITSFVFNTECVHQALFSIGTHYDDIGYWPHQFLFFSILFGCNLPPFSYSHPLAIQGSNPSHEFISVIKWASLEGNRLNVVSSYILKIPFPIKLILLIRELYSYRFLRLLLLLAIVSPFSKYPFYLTQQKLSVLKLLFNFASFPIYSYHFIFSTIFYFLNKYAKFYIALCSKYGVSPSSSADFSCSRFSDLSGF